MMHSRRILRLFSGPLWMNWLYVVFIFAGLESVFRLLDAVAHETVSQSVWTIFLATVTALPAKLYQYAPLMVLIATASGIGLLARNSELTVLRAAGLSRARITAIAVAIFSPLFVGVWVFGEYGVPESERMHRQLMDAPEQRAMQRVWTREGDVFVVFEANRDGAVRGRTSYQLNPDDRQVVEINAAKGAGLESQWVPEQMISMRLQPDAIRLNDPKVSSQSAEIPKTVAWLLLDPDVLTLSELWQASTYLAAQGVNARQYEQLFWQRVLMPVALMILIVVAVSTSFGSFRQVDLATRVFSAVVLGLAYKYAVDLSSPFVFLLGWHPAFSAILPLCLPLVLIPLLLKRT